MEKSKGSAFLATLEIDKKLKIPIYRQLEKQLRQIILNGTLVSKQKLPSTRDFALEMGVSRTTVKTVYEQLVAEGYLETKTGAGTFVSEGLISQKLSIDKFHNAASFRRIQHFSKIAEKINGSKASIRFGSTHAFRPGVPALDLSLIHI